MDGYRTSLLWELYGTAYSLGKLTSKATKANSGGWENLKKGFNQELASRKMAPRTLQQMKEKINNLKSDHKKIKDKESQTGQETQAKPFWFDMVDRVFGSKDVIDPPFFLFYSSKSGYENKRKATDREGKEGHVDQLGDGDEMFAPSTSKGAGKSKADRDRESSNLEQHPVKGYVRRRGLKS